MNLWDLLGFVVELWYEMRAAARTHGQHGTFRIDLVLVDTTTNADLDRRSGPTVTL